ncbi:Ribosomal RNA large subunit methyltransferase K/L [Enhygromyxa salina]|uniref:Ribosomal RNA large subunit methyltransferase K/L n=1 Tax=Enhygromyxa salina TaxID=215803 RepID=A0A2S9XMX4_9BACT|nr:bifunctional 23S rRNA (guanine(2069)-N(7))-methyltransferase RlmK/23S rRNA (guanine(2445)-N(2))-methyltransferase RlmL [Enhygromyxa salina]PRP94041.1 Ribosomal RNA large subunit methyltransferase K/L [Enhygromyxa salina]
MTHEFFATVPHGAEDLLAAELESLGVSAPRQRAGGVAFTGSLELGYRACLWSRLAGRVLLRIAELPATDGDALYTAARAIRWTDHLGPGRTFAISAAGRADPDSGIDNTHFAALRVKDGLVDALRERWGSRPDVELDRPDLRLRLHLRGQLGTLSVDLAGEGLHRRGYRVASVAAPLRENLAAAVLLRASWRDRPAFVDPMCGSATLLIEAAWMAADVAPGLLRRRWGLEGWAGHEPELWRGLVEEAKARREAGLAGALPRLIGYDAEPDAVRAALACIDAAGLRGVIHVEKRPLAEVEACATPATPPAGLVVSNPPWGERLGNRRELESLYAALGRLMRERFAEWDAAVLTGDPSLGRSLGIRARRRNVLHDGPIECQILRLEIPAPAGPEAGEGAAVERAPRERSEGMRSFANRLAKNQKKLRKWVRREGVSCYRIYAADIPEYNFAVDLYADAERGLTHAHVQEYAPPATVDEAAARHRRGEALAVIREDLGLPRERVHLKRRERQKGRKQYQKLDDSGREFVVAEGPARLWVNLDDYLDTGLFLDHRPVRARLREAAAGKQVLNLFCYTATASVHAALGRATATTSVDLSRTYLEWGARNFALNGFACVGPEDKEGGSGGRRGRPAHELVRADVLEWVREQGARRWDLILCDPPSFSNSKRMSGTLDVQRDHVEIIRRCVRLLRPRGQLWFSTNLRKFELDEGGLTGLRVEELRDTVPPDFARAKTVHRCWVIARDVQA